MAGRHRTRLPELGEGVGTVAVVQRHVAIGDWVVAPQTPPVILEPDPLCVIEG
jgi:hypothetical protein